MLDKVLPVVGCNLVIAVVALALYFTYYLLVAVKPPELWCAPGPLRDLLLRDVPAVTLPLRPAPWGLDGRLQTALAGPLRRLLPAPDFLPPQPLRLADGGTVTLHWVERLTPPRRPCSPRPRPRPVLLVVPGLTGDERAPYVRPLAAAAAALDAECCVLAQRGVRHRLTSPRLYSALSHDDLSEVLAHLRARRAGPLLAVGVSLGGLLVCGHVTRAGVASPLTAALAVSAPLDVPAGAARLERGAGAALSRAMARDLRRVLSGAGAAPSPALSAALGARSVREFDAAWTAPGCGFGSAEEYYAAASLCGRLSGAALPLLCVCAADDPLQPRASLPLREAARSARTAVLVTARGGHIGFAEAGRWWGARPKEDFLCRVTRQYFGAVLRRRAARATTLHRSVHVGRAHDGGQ